MLGMLGDLRETEDSSCRSTASGLFPWVPTSLAWLWKLHFMFKNGTRE